MKGIKMFRFRRKSPESVAQSSAVPPPSSLIPIPEEDLPAPVSVESFESNRPLGFTFIINAMNFEGMAFMDDLCRRLSMLGRFQQHLTDQDWEKDLRSPLYQQAVHEAFEEPENICADCLDSFDQVRFLLTQGKILKIDSTDGNSLTIICQKFDPSKVLRTLDRTGARKSLEAAKAAYA